MKKIGDAGRHLLPHVGLRKAKSLLAIFVGFWLWQAVRIFFPELEVHPLYIYFYGLIEIRDSSEKTVNLGKSRLKATFTGLGTGLPLLAFCEFLKGLVPEGWAYIAVELGVLLVGVLITLIVAEKVGCKTFCGIAAIIFVLLLVAHQNDERYIYSVLRACQTILGVFVAWLINVKLFPYPGKPKEEAKGETRS